MKTKRFTLLQLMNVINDTISTPNGIDDAKAILSHLFNTTVLEPEVGRYIQELKNYTPLWLIAIRHELRIIEIMYGDKRGIFDFRSKTKRYQDMVVIIGKEFNYFFDIPQLKEYADKE